MPRAKKVTTTVEPTGCAAVGDVIVEWGDGVRPAPAFDAYQLATIAATQLTVTPHDSNDIIDLRIDRALHIAGKLLNKAKEVQ